MLGLACPKVSWLREGPFDGGWTNGLVSAVPGSPGFRVGLGLARWGLVRCSIVQRRFGKEVAKLGGSNEMFELFVRKRKADGAVQNYMLVGHAYKLA